ncbi:hypothetical protein KFL_000090140 [Klebsormidium nitens]|uniref:Uncharacterized protein n=1 Tax=Klebsormidium nitens TaxID=105231 RepID=A0A1Y1HQR2_KLENI|nr:hypothetical protein KFL_000090140 [Klebsormidium nitens]|eukprot:GAQ78168.1 hypothetical protein KFL_000090140 [Klebsormidium nitens]
MGTEREEGQECSVDITRGQPAHGSFSLGPKLGSLLALPASVAGFEGAVASPANQGYTVYLCDFAQQPRIRTRLFGHTGIVAQLNASEALPHLLASASHDSSAKIWDLRTESAVCTLESRTYDSLAAVALCAPGGSYPLCFTGGDNECVQAWDLRMMRGLYELSTGNNEPAALYWHEVSQSLLAVTDCMHITGHGFGPGYVDVSDEEGGEGPNATDYRWPGEAKHSVHAFRARWDVGYQSFIRYTFSRSPAGAVPESSQPPRSFFSF